MLVKKVKMLYKKIGVKNFWCKKVKILFKKLVQKKEKILVEK